MKLFNISNSPSTGKARKAHYRKLLIEDDLKIISIVLTIRSYEANGAEVDYNANPDIEDYQRILRAHNETLVNPATEGTPVYADGFTEELESDAEGNTTAVRTPIYKDLLTHEVVENPVGYYDFFAYIIENVPTIVMDAIAINIAFEDSMGGLNKRN